MLSCHVQLLHCANFVAHVRLSLVTHGEGPCDGEADRVQYIPAGSVDTLSCRMMTLALTATYRYWWDARISNNELHYSVGYLVGSLNVVHGVSVSKCQLLHVDVGHLSVDLK